MFFLSQPLHGHSSLTFFQTVKLFRFLFFFMKANTCTVSTKDIICHISIVHGVWISSVSVASVSYWKGHEFETRSHCSYSVVGLGGCVLPNVYHIGKDEFSSEPKQAGTYYLLFKRNGYTSKLLFQRIITLNVLFCCVNITSLHMVLFQSCVNISAEPIRISAFTQACMLLRLLLLNQNPQQ